MKQCPKCNQVYADSSLNFCLNDGTPLVQTVSSAPTLIISADSTPTEPLRLRYSPGTRKGIKPIYFYTVIGLLALTVGGGIFLWRDVKTGALKNTPSPSAIDPSQNKEASKDNAEISGAWIFATEVADGRIKVYYLRQGRTFKLKFTNDDATAQIKYKVRGEEKIKGEWRFTETPEVTVTVKKGQQQFDNLPLPSEVEEIRNIEVEIIDWNYK